VAVQIKPLEDRILVEVLDAETKTASGLVIPDTAKEKPQEGKVIAVGPGRFDEDGEKRIPMDIKTGDTVIFLRRQRLFVVVSTRCSCSRFKIRNPKS
jgi:chaperonin GroES